jgi:hypothetical protein
MSTQGRIFEIKPRQLSFPGFYSRSFHESEKRDLKSRLREGLQDEIEMVRASMQRTWKQSKGLSNLKESRRTMLAMAKTAIYLMRLMQGHEKMVTSSNNLDEVYIKAIDQMAKEINWL